MVAYQRSGHKGSTLSHLHILTRPFHQCLSKPIIITFSSLFKGKKISGSMVILYLTNDLIQCSGQFTWKKLGLFITSSGAVQIFFSNGTLAKIQAIKLFQETLTVVSLFHYLSNNSQFQLMRTKVNCLSSGRLLEVRKTIENCNKHLYKWWLMRIDGLWEVPFTVIWLRNFWHFKKIVTNKRRSLMRGGYKGRFNCIKIWHNW